MQHTRKKNINLFRSLSSMLFSTSLPSRASLIRMREEDLIQDANISFREIFFCCLRCTTRDCSCYVLNLEVNLGSAGTQKQTRNLRQGTWSFFDH